MSMTDYNARMVPILAPSGFPSSLALPSSDSAFFVPAVQALQQELGLKADGQCGPKTIQAIAAREYARAKACERGGGLIIIGPRVMRTDVETRTYLDEGFEWLGDTKSSPRKQALRLGVIHYDVTNDSKTTHAVLKRRNLSTHFLIDADGTLYQAHDPITAVCIHAGSRANSMGLGVDLNSPALRQYERLEKGQAPRDEVSTRVHGRTLKMLDYWAIQITALKALMSALEDAAGLPRACPRDEDGEPILGVYDARYSHHGWIGHYHITASKIDPAPLSWNAVCPA
jgi:hypothetical protein